CAKKGIYDGYYELAYW
nr:immunoglobulin heavy chain junction region [Mus musculus]